MELNLEKYYFENRVDCLYLFILGNSTLKWFLIGKINPVSFSIHLKKLQNLSNLRLEKNTGENPSMYCPMGGHTLPANGKFLIFDKTWV